MERISSGIPPSTRKERVSARVAARLKQTKHSALIITAVGMMLNTTDNVTHFHLPVFTARRSYGTSES